MRLFCPTARCCKHDKPKEDLRKQLKEATKAIEKAKKPAGPERDGFDGWTIRWVRNWLAGCTRRVAVNGSMSKWRPVTSAAPWGWHQDLVLFNMDAGTESTLSSLADDINLCGGVDTVEGRDGEDRVLGRP
ncbi:hypothetical protein DUI87_04704 [Hirundo rustica rustica]|uniref:Uncharacterized protein n=1 Tax=Hirundo rustica rustica TaxID=333673 RepID=A0A3M0KZV9_HIRRU|nr:hypothetical protein DUI87_04704 [Hirundo rustica rustica]